ncbi:helix-turn-helix domain-containing protein [Erwinia billingiae]|uniref:helix-turn-helix domain-containing protein n=1 Tax=Erwinia billingiae TaxID=182337 RepID=UPI002AF6C8E8|nr:helix-turn-helix domain-containing protein [Erwinia billingiae]
MPISQIAWKYGFNDMAYFSRVFRAKFSYSPTEYRHQAGNTKLGWPYDKLQ